MIELLKILFFSKLIILTSTGVMIDDQLVLDLDPPISALTSGAHIEIDLSGFYSHISIKKTGMTESWALLEELIPNGSVKAEMFNEHETIVLDEMTFSLLNDGSKIILSSKNGVPVDMEFSRLKITTSVPLDNVTVAWKNHIE